MGSIVVGLVKVQMGVQTNGYPPQWLIDLAEPVTKTFGVGIPPSVAIWAVRHRRVRDLPAPHPHGARPVRDRGEPARG